MLIFGSFLGEKSGSDDILVNCTLSNVYQE